MSTVAQLPSIQHTYQINSLHVYTINLPDTVTLDGAYDGSGASTTGQSQGHDLLQWTVGLQQQHRRRRLREAEVAA